MGYCLFVVDLKTQYREWLDDSEQRSGESMNHSKFRGSIHNLLEESEEYYGPLLANSFGIETILPERHNFFTMHSVSALYTLNT